MLNIDHIGVLIGVGILIVLLITCHVANSSRSNFQDANKIIYYSSSDKMTTGTCPGSHPQIPCSLVKECPKTGDKLTLEQKTLVDQYVYLATLLNTVDIYKFKNPGYWYL
jgi:hypothetical protein